MGVLKKLFSLLKFNWPIAGICLIWLILAIANFTPGTYLSGWDSLQTELSPVLAIKRAFFSAWQEYQSFGLAAGMGHAADLPRAIILWVASFAIPAPIIRYFFNISMVLLAGVGMYKLIEQSFSSKQPHKSAAFIGALMYIFNFFVAELMALPFESFSVFFAALPWELWAFLRILTNKNIKKSDYLLFAVIFLLATPQAIALQLFAVLGVLLGLMALGRIINTRSILVAKRAAIGFAIVLAINAFWILPQGYFLKTGAAVVTEAKANQLSTQDIFYRNKDKGNPIDFFTSTGFFADGVNSSQQLIFADWQNHRATIPVAIILYLLAGLTIFGILVPSKYRLSFLFSYIVILIALANNTFPFDLINLVIRKSSFVNQVFRSPFTKFGIPAALVSAYFGANGAAFIFERIRKVGKKINPATIIFEILIIGAILYSALPAFSGHFFANNMKVKIPESYFSLMNYFKTVDKNQRIGLLPEYTHWGWYDLDWGYDGSGFLWYGIEQPVISRTFDVWSAVSENYYWEVKHAIEAENLTELENVLQKYDVSYLVLDRSAQPLIASAKALSYDKIQDMLSQSNNIKLEKNWGEIYVYKVAQNKKVNSFMWGVSNIPNSGPRIQTTNFDTAYQSQKDYVTNENIPLDTYYPYLDVTSQTDITKNWKLTESDSGWTFSRPLPDNIGQTKRDTLNGTVELPFYQNGEVVNYLVPYTISFLEGEIRVEFPKIIIDSFVKNKNPNNCVDQPGTNYTIRDGKIEITGRDGAYSCFYFDDQSLSQKYGYIVKIQNKNLEGQRLFFYIKDATKEQSYVESRLSEDTQYFILGQRFDYGLGYSFAFQTTSYKTIQSKNELSAAEIYIMPYDVLKNIFIKKPGFDGVKTKYYEVDANKLNYYLYTASLENQRPDYLVLDQAYQPGWFAYNVSDFNFWNRNFPFLFGKRIQSHVVIDNWANGWKISNENSNVVLLYWPQYLEYMGISILVGTFVILILWTAKLPTFLHFKLKKKTSHSHHPTAK